MNISSTVSRVAPKTAGTDKTKEKLNDSGSQFIIASRARENIIKEIIVKRGSRDFPIYKADLNNPGIYPSADVMKRLEYLVDVGEATRIYDQIWTELKAA